MDKLEQFEEWSQRYLEQVNEMVGALKHFLKETGCMEDVESGKWYEFRCQLQFREGDIRTDGISLSERR